MVWGRHWKQRIGVTLARGRGQVVMAELRVKGGGEGPKGERGWATQEWDPNVGGGPPAAVQPEERRDEAAAPHEPRLAVLRPSRSTIRRPTRAILTQGSIK